MSQRIPSVTPDDIMDAMHSQLERSDGQGTAGQSCIECAERLQIV